MRNMTPKPSPQRGELRVQDLATFLNTNARRIEGWVEQGLVKPARAARGTGHPNRFSVENLATGYILTELQRVHGDRSPVLGSLMASEHTGKYAELLSKWLGSAFVDAEVSGLPELPTLTLVHDGDGVVDGRVSKADDEGLMPGIPKQSRSDCVGITVLRPGRRFSDIRERLMGPR
jgi:hypothetical protein